MNWTSTLIFLMAFTAIKPANADDSDLNQEIKVQEESKLNSNLRSALLQVLTDLENEKNEAEDTEMDVEKAHASAITIFANHLNISRDASDEKPLPEPSVNLPEAQFLIISNSSTSDHDENIITSATSSFVSDSPESKEEISQKKGGFKNLNSISDDEPNKPSKLITSKEEPFIKTYVKSLGNDVDEDRFVYVQSSKSHTTTTTEAPVEVSTEENEAKIEQVQFFMAPLVAAFTVHQDETGQPKKVEPIYKSENEPVQQLQPSQSPQSDDLRQKQLILEQELQQLRQQQQDLARNNQFNQFDPIFTEPDRTVVTKLAAIDPSNILNAAQQGPVLNKFTANEAIMPLQLNPAPTEVQPINNGGVSLVPSISFDPSIEAGKLPENAKQLPNKEPTGFHNFVALPKQPVFNSGFTASFNQPNNFVQQPQYSSPTTNFINNQPSTFSIVPAQQPFPPKLELGVFPQNNRFLRQETQTGLLPPVNNFLTIPQNFNNQPPNRILRNNGFSSVNQQSPSRFSIQQSIQPFPPQFSQYVKSNQNNRFLRSNQEGNFGNNQNGFQRPLLQHYKYTSPFGFPGRFH